MGEWENIRVPARTKAIVKQISKNTHRPMYKVVAEALEGKASINNLRLYEIDQELIGMADMIAVIWRKRSQLNLSKNDVYGIIDNMSRAAADEIERLEMAKANELMANAGVTHGPQD